MRYILILICVLFSNLLFAQGQRFTTAGVIEFEKRVNTYGLIQKIIDNNKSDASWYAPLFESYKKTQPQFKALKSTMSFAQNKTLFTPVTDESNPSNFFNLPAATQPNTIFTDVLAKTSVSQKKIYEETFLVKDSTRKINWKLTSETREIAGYTCRRANALIMDSIYVVAFYTDQIPVSGGPESFTGLPGMILGVALPHENVTWFATKVTDVTIPETTVVPPKKGKVVDNKQLRTTLESALKSWGTSAKELFKNYLL